MEEFSVRLLDKSYRIEPQENGTFRVFDKDEKIGVIYPVVADQGEEWETMDELEEGFVSQIGELISEHNM